MPDVMARAIGYCRTLLLGLLLLGSLWLIKPEAVWADVHVYSEHPEQVTYRSRQSVRDDRDRAWQAIAFKRWQKTVHQGTYLRLVGFPGAIAVDRQHPVLAMTATGDRWYLPTAAVFAAVPFPDSVGQYDLQPLLRDLSFPLPLTLQIPLINAEPAKIRVAPFVVQEWLQIKAANGLSPVGSALGKESQDDTNQL